MITLSSRQVGHLRDDRRARFERKLSGWLEANGPRWAARSEDDRRALASAADRIARVRECHLENYVARIALALDGAGDWQRFVAEEALLLPPPEVDEALPPQAFAHQLPGRAAAFAARIEGGAT